MATTRKEELVETAVELFSKNGFHATGIDKILAEAGVAKMTLYKHFKSKDDLIVASLRKRDERFRRWLRDTVQARAKSPKKRLLAVFDALEEWFSSDTFQGCLFINATAEFGDPDDPIHAAAAEHKELVRLFLTELADAAGADDPDELAHQLYILVQGATVSAHVTGDVKAARQARKVAKMLIKNSGV